MNIYKNGLFIWEQKTIPEEDMGTGLIAKNNGLKAFFSCLFIFCLSVIIHAPMQPIGSILTISIALLCARMVSIDLSHLVIPNIYVALLGVLAIIHHSLALPFTWEHFSPYIYGALIGLGLPLLTAFIANLSGEKGMIGGGDIKFMAVAGLWVGSTMVLPFIFCATFIGLILTVFRKDTQEMPMAPALCITLWLFIFYFPEEAALAFLQTIITLYFVA